MSRSNPTQNNPHPCTRWFEFSGADGEISYYNKESKETVTVPTPFTFIWLDETSTVRGWHDASESGIMSNEVRDTRSDVMVVKAFKAGELCHGLYSQIRDRVAGLGGHYAANCYLGYRENNGPLKLGCLQLKGAALNAWVEFRKATGNSIHTGAVSIAGTKDGKKGSVKFKTPVFTSKEIKAETNDEALVLDRELQTYLLGYFKRTKVEQVAAAPPPPSQEQPATPAYTDPPSEPDPEPPPDDGMSEPF